MGLSHTTENRRAHTSLLTAPHTCAKMTTQQTVLPHATLHATLLRQAAPHVPCRDGPRLTAGSPTALGVGSTLSGRMGMLGRGLGTGSTLPLAGTRGESLEGPPPCPAEAAATHIDATFVQVSFCRLVAAVAQTVNKLWLDSMPTNGSWHVQYRRTG